MADYNVTEVVIVGVPMPMPVRVGSRIRFDLPEFQETAEGIVDALDNVPEGGIGAVVVLRPSMLGYEIRDMANVRVLDDGQGDDDPDEGRAIKTERHRTAWDRVLDGEGTP